MGEQIPKKFEDLPEDSPPERKAAIIAFDSVVEDVAVWAKEHPNASKGTLLHQSIPKTCDTESIRKLTARLRWFLDNEATRRDFEESFGSEE